MRFEVEDPTQQGFWQVIDTHYRTGPWKETYQVQVSDPITGDVKGQPKTIDHPYGGRTYVVAVFSAYLTEAGIDAENEARKLANKLNAMPPSPPPQDLDPQDVKPLNVTKNGTVVAMFREPYCPDAGIEAAALAGRLGQPEHDTILHSGKL